MKVKIFTVFILLLLAFNVSSVFAYENAGLLEDIFENGNDFFNPDDNKDIGAVDGDNGFSWLTGGGRLGFGENIAEFITKAFIPIISLIGNFAFFVVGAILGIKYIWSGVEGKSSVKETLPTFVVGAIFFYLADRVYNFAFGVTKSIFNVSEYETLESNIWVNLAFIVNVLAIAGIVALGIKYMFSNADVKASIKKDLVPVLIGIMFVFATSAILNFIVNATSDIIPQ